MRKYDLLLTQIPKTERWSVEDKFIVILNMINRYKFNHACYDFITEQQLKRKIMNYMKQNNISSLKESIDSYHKRIREQVLKGELHDK